MLPLPLAMLLWFHMASDAHLRGLDLFKQHKYTEALPVLEEVIKSEPLDSDDYRETAMLIGQSYFLLSQAPRPSPGLKKFRPPTSQVTCLAMRTIRPAKKRKGVASFARLFGVGPQSAAAHLLTGEMLIKRQLEDAGADEIRKALALNPRIPEAHYALGEITMFRGRVADSIRELEQELAINPSFSMAWYRLGDAYVRQENWDVAIANLQRAVWLNKNFSGPYILLGKCYYKKRDFSNAERFLRQALEIDPKNYMATYLLGQTLIADGKTEEGRAVLKRSASLRDTGAE